MELVSFARLLLQLGVVVPFVLLVLSLNASLQEEVFCGIPESVLEVSVLEIREYLFVPVSEFEFPENLDDPASVFELPANLDDPRESNLDVLESVLAELTGRLFPNLVTEDPESELARLDLQLDVPLVRLLE